MIAPARHPAFDAAARHAQAMLWRLTPKWLRAPAPRLQGCAPTLTGASLIARLGAWRISAQQARSSKDARIAALAYCQLFSDARAMAFPPPRGLRARTGDTDATHAILACCRELSTLSKAWSRMKNHSPDEAILGLESVEEYSLDDDRGNVAPRPPAAMILQIVSALQPWETGFGAHPIAQAALFELGAAIGDSTLCFLVDICAQAESSPRRLGWSHNQFLASAQAELFRRCETAAIDLACGNPAPENEPSQPRRI